MLQLGPPPMSMLEEIKRDVIEKTHPKRKDKDPETGLTRETARKRDLCARYDKMAKAGSVYHRLKHYPTLTNTQVSGLLRKTRNRSEFNEMSDGVWSVVYDEKRRADEYSGHDPIDFYKDFYQKINRMNLDDDFGELTDPSDNEYPEEDDEEDEHALPVFEEVQTEEEESENSHNILVDMFNYFEKRRFLMEEEKLLQLQIKRITERRNQLRQIFALEDPSPQCIFDEPSVSNDEDPTERCARCIPLKSRKPRKIITADFSKISKLQEPTMMKNYLSLPYVESDQHLHNMSVCIEDDFDDSHSYLSERRRGRPRNAQAKSDEATLYRARARYYAKQQLRGSEKKRCVGRPRKLSGEPSPVKPARQLTVIKKKPLPLVEKEKKTTVVMQHTMLLENERDAKILEEQLHRLGKDYTYGEITVPQYRSYNEQSELDRIQQQMSRRASMDSSYKMSIEDLKDYSLDDHGEVNEALTFAKIHHLIEYPRVTEEEIKRRKKEKINFIPEFRPFAPELYAHEDPSSEVLKVSVINNIVPPHPSSFIPGLKTECCTVIHEEPIMVNILKQRIARTRQFSQRRHKDSEASSRSRSSSPMPPEGCARTRGFMTDKDLLIIEIGSFHSMSNSPALTPNTDFLPDTPSPSDAMSLTTFLDRRRVNYNFPQPASGLCSVQRFFPHPTDLSIYTLDDPCTSKSQP